MFVLGLSIFSAVSLAGGLAQDPVLLASRAVQGVGAAIVAPAVLSLITTGFAEELSARALSACTARPRQSVSWPVRSSAESSSSRREEHAVKLQLSAAEIELLARMGPTGHHVQPDEFRRRAAALSEPVDARGSFVVLTYRPRWLAGHPRLTAAPSLMATRGAGRALGELVLDQARADCFRAMQFNAVVETNTRAVALWRSLGFAAMATLPEAFNHPVKGYVVLNIMYRRL
jgi:hypothetical protein